MTMHEDRRDLRRLLNRVAEAAADFQDGLDDRPAQARQRALDKGGDIPSRGIGAEGALDAVLTRFAPHMSASAGPRYLGFVTGGTTPAALLGDWLAGSFDQNTASPGDSIGVAVTVQALDWLKQLFGLPSEAFDGAFTTGATGANFACLLAAREWAGEGAGYDIAKRGLAGGPPIAIYSACPHASFVKVARFSGLGQDSIRPVARIGDTEEMDAAALEAALEAAPEDERKIVCASAGTVTTTAFDNLPAIAAICKRHGAWLHVDGAFGLFARAVPELAGRVAGVELADSIASDGHKWLNVPYDCGFYVTRRIDLVEHAAGALPAYLDVAGDGLPHYINRVLEGSQRFRGLPVWMTLAAHGAEGVRRIVRDNVRQATALSTWIDGSSNYELLAPTTLNVVCFRATPPEGIADADSWNDAVLDTLNAAGDVFMTPGAYGGKKGFRAAFSNWSTQDEDMPKIFAALDMAYQSAKTAKEAEPA